MFKPRDYQDIISNDAVEILRQKKIVYLCMAVFFIKSLYYNLFFVYLYLQSLTCKGKYLV